MNFSYEAINSAGQMVTGSVVATHERDAARQLERKGLSPIRVEVAQATAKRRVRGKLSVSQLILSLYELATMLSAGVAIADAVDAQAQAPAHPDLTQAHRYMASALRRGEAFSAALLGCKLPVPAYVHQLVAAGEMTGQLASALRDGVAQMEYEEKMRTEMRNALIYPSVLVCSGVGAVMLMFFYVVPKFAHLAKRAKDLPWLADAVLSTGTWCNENAGLLAGLVVAAVALIVGISRLPSLRVAVMDRASRMPIIGDWLVEAETARWSKILGALLANRVPVLKALELAANGVRLPQRRNRLSVVSAAVKGGVALSAALEENDALTTTGYNLVRVGERSGELPKMLTSLATLYEESGRTRMKRVLVLIEPIAILVIGALVGLIITGVVLAIVSANDAVI